MLKWKHIKDTYLYDGTFEGFLTVVFECYVSKVIPFCIIPEEKYEYNLFDSLFLIKTDENKSKRIFEGISKNISQASLYHAYNTFLCEYDNKELYLLKYISYGFQVGPQIDSMLQLDFVFKVHQMRKKALFECHRLKGLVRFIELKNHIYYASIHPDHCIIEPLGHHFMKRLPNQTFILHDKNRNLFFLYAQNHYVFRKECAINLPSISEVEKQYQKLWQLFFKSIAIPERKNRCCQMNFMPKKYWKDLIEDPYNT